MMSTTIVAAQHSFDELIEQMERKVSMAEIERRTVAGKAPDGESMFDKTAHDKEQQTLLEQAVTYLGVGKQSVEATIDDIEAKYAPDLDDKCPLPIVSAEASEIVTTYLTSETPSLAIMEGVDPSTREEALALWRAVYIRRRQLFLWAWQRDRLLHFGNLFYKERPGEPPKEELLLWLGAKDALETGEASLAETSPTRPPRPIISPAFMHDGRVGLGRISADQVTFALYDAMIAPKDAWSKTAKGWPIYKPNPASDMLAIKILPIVENRNNLDAQRAEMWQIVQELGVSDFDVIAMMMAQVLEEGRADGRAILPADTMLDYRKVSRRRDENGHSAGHQPKARVNISESVYRIAHLRVSADGLPLLAYNPKGGVTSSQMDINEPVVELHSNYSRKRDDKTLLWEYSLGRWFTTFREKPNAYTAYMLERALSYHPTKQQWAKQLTYYLALEMRRNADNGRELHRPVSWFIKGARIPCDPRYALKVKDRLEGGLRQITKDGLTRIVQDDQVIDASSPALDHWRPKGAENLTGREWLGAYLKLDVGIRCDADTEDRYDVEIRKRKATVLDRKARTSTPTKRPAK